MIKVLELFSGTGSVGKCCQALGWDVVSVDMILPADHQVDIMDFDYKQYPKDHFDIVWASPPCTNYSHLKKCWYGRMLQGSIYTKQRNEMEQDEADQLVLKSLEIIEYFQPELWFLENPQTGNLKNREIMKGIPFYDVDYCMYSDWGYKKRTRIWTNKQHWENRLCDGSGTCGNMIKNTQMKHKLNSSKEVHTIGEKKTKKTHKQVCDGGYDKRKKNQSQNNSGTNKLDRYRVPEDLIFSLFLD